MKFLRCAAIASLAFLGACATTTAPPITLTSSYSPYAHMVRPGQGGISGNALLRTVGGDAKTCAGFPVQLMPDTPYVRERMTHIYGNAERGYGAPGRQFSPPNSHYQTEAGQRATCDAQGNFEFSNIEDGSYYLVSIVYWGVPTGGQFSTISQQGGSLMQRVTVSGGRTVRVVLTQ